MDEKKRMEIVEECKRLKAAINKSQSPMLKRDYWKRLRKLQGLLLKG